MSRTPARGDIVWIDMDPGVGHEQSERRPALVLTPERYNVKTGLAILCPITAKVKGYPFEVPLPPGLPVAGVVLADHVKNLDWASRGAEFACALPKAEIDAVLAVLGRLLSAD